MLAFALLAPFVAVSQPAAPVRPSACPLLCSLGSPPFFLCCTTLWGCFSSFCGVASNDLRGNVASRTHKSTAATAVGEWPGGRARKKCGRGDRAPTPLRSRSSSCLGKPRKTLSHKISLSIFARVCVAQMNGDYRACTGAADDFKVRACDWLRVPACPARVRAGGLRAVT